MKYLVQVWTKDIQKGAQHSYKFGFRDYWFLKSYEAVNTTILTVKND